ncbi:hypothetical protein [Paraburkholderia kururiensis]|uniref:hypothetical protein n=1 Tax=Paraburkholderia kururiensis TaxID=984307 RepID=UPI00157B71C7|nr:hypothetical protein [Paraburkholderia kururiensis]
MKKAGAAYLAVGNSRAHSRQGQFDGVVKRVSLASMGGKRWGSRVGCTRYVTLLASARRALRAPDPATRKRAFDDIVQALAKAAKLAAQAKDKGDR